MLNATARRASESVAATPLLCTCPQALQLDGEKDAAIMEGCLLEEDLAVARAEVARLTRLLAERGSGEDAVCILAPKSHDNVCQAMY